MCQLQRKQVFRLKYDEGNFSFGCCEKKSAMVNQEQLRQASLKKIFQVAVNII